ncbi:MAG: GNAT family N-acetyltransferase [Cellulomonadaceae bacterium]|nr:GNAT family N-acetyltransferase [Cellulomonadaceae bacterium]
MSGGVPQLRRLTQDDAADVLAAFVSSPDMLRQGDVATLEDAQDYVTRLLGSASPHEPWALAEAGRLVGLVCVSVDASNRSGWFWYWMNDAARGRGWMTRAAATVAAWALADRGLERLELGHRTDNPASGAVARAAGFVKEGTERQKFLVGGRRLDVDVYGRLRTDPSPDFDPVLMCHN